MDQFDKAFEETKASCPNSGPENILIIGDASKALDSMRASLEVAGHNVSQVSTISSFEEAVIQDEYNAIISTTEPAHFAIDQLFELLSLLAPSVPFIGFSTSPKPTTIIECIRYGCADFFCIPEDLKVIPERVKMVLDLAREAIFSQENATQIANVCEVINEERHRVVEENDSLCNDLSNSHCESQKKMRQVAIAAEFKTLIGQELDVESMLRTALGYMLTRLGATNAAVYLREGDVDWGLGAFINYDRQPEQFQPLIDSLGTAICPIMASEKRLKKYTDGEAFADFLELDPVDFSGCEILTFGCFHESKCRAVITLFRGDTSPFDTESVETVDTLRTIFGQQLGSILKIHKRAEVQWPSESLDDDDWTFGKAA